MCVKYLTFCLIFSHVFVFILKSRAYVCIYWIWSAIIKVDRSLNQLVFYWVKVSQFFWGKRDGFECKLEKSSSKLQAGRQWEFVSFWQFKKKKSLKFVLKKNYLKKLRKQTILWDSNLQTYNQFRSTNLLHLHKVLNEFTVQ